MAIGGFELKSVSLQRGDQRVLREVSLKISSGEKIVLIGPSGQGKSTLLKMLGGLLPPTQGTCMIDGQDLYALSESGRRETMLRMGMLFQKNALFDSLTVAENIAFPLQETTKLPAEEILQRVLRFLEAVGLSHAQNLYPDEISGGMQKRLGIARALALDPEIVLYDDPTAGLDPITSLKIIELILELQKRRDSTVVAITNDMARAYQLADRIFAVFAGEVIETGTPEQTRNHPDPRVQQFIRGQVEGPLTAAL